MQHTLADVVCPLPLLELIYNHCNPHVICSGQDEVDLFLILFGPICDQVAIFFAEDVQQCQVQAFHTFKYRVLSLLPCFCLDTLSHHEFFEYYQLP